MSKEAMKLALEALELSSVTVDSFGVQGKTREAITALREALAEQPAPATELREQEPVAYAVYHRMGGSKSLHWHEQHSPDGDANEYQLLPLYTSPPAQRKPLTDKEQIAEALRRHGLTLIKTASGYDVLKLGQINAHGIKENT